MRQKASLRTIGKHCTNSILQADAKAAKPNLFVLPKKKNSSIGLSSVFRKFSTGVLSKSMELAERERLAAANLSDEWV